MGPYDWKFYWSWNGRISARSYLLGTQLVGLAGLVLTVPLFVLSAMRSPIVSGGSGLGLFLCIFLALCVPWSSLAIRRAHDLGWSGALPAITLITPLVVILFSWTAAGAFGKAMQSWAAGTGAVLVFLFPVSAIPAVCLSLWLNFRKGQHESNRYGPPPA